MKQAILFFILATGVACAFTLGEGGKILVDSAASVQEKYAAAELEKYLREATGAEFSVINDGTARFAVGTAAARKVDPKLNLQGLGQDGIIIKMIGDTLVLTGGEGASRGTLNAVYTFLEDTVGYRWFAPPTGRPQGTATVVPKAASLKIPKLDVRYVPQFTHQRNVLFSGSHMNPDWLAKNKAFGSYMHLKPEQGGQQVYIPGFVHTFNEILHPQKYFKEHPEWFSELGGKRVGWSSQWCMSNKELQQFVVDYAREKLKNAPPTAVLSLSQNDWNNNCTCVECKAIDAEEGSPSGAILRFLNGVAEALNKDFPLVRIETLAYMYSAAAPKITKPHPNVTVRLALIDQRNYAQPLTHPDNAKPAEMVRDWGKVAPNNLEVWDYAVNFRRPLAPFPNFKSLGEDVKFYAANKVAGMFEEGNHYSAGGDFQDMRRWVLAKLLWDPNRDTETLIKEFVEGYYGKEAAPFILDYIAKLTKAVEDIDHKLTIYETYHPYLTIDFLRSAEDIFDKAITAAETSEQKARARAAKMQIQYVILAMSAMLEDELAATSKPWPFKQSKADMLTDFIDLHESGGFIIENHARRDADLEKLKTIATTEPTKIVVPPFAKDIPRSNWFEVQSAQFSIHNEGSWGSHAADPLASNSSAIWMPGNHAQWAINQLPMPKILTPEVNDKPWDVYVAVRADLKPDASGKAFSAGSWLSGEKRGEANLSLTAEELSATEYRWFKIGTIAELNDKRMIWMAPANNDGVEKVWIDRLIYVKAK